MAPRAARSGQRWQREQEKMGVYFGDGAPELAGGWKQAGEAVEDSSSLSGQLALWWCHL